VVNANTMMFLNEELPQSCAFISKFVKDGGVSSYYPDEIVLFYMLSRPYYNGVKCLRTALNDLSLRLRNKYIKDDDIKINSVMKLSLFTTALISAGDVEKEIIRMLLYNLLQIRNSDEVWKSEFFFHGGDKNTDFYYGSAQLSALFYAEALQFCLDFLWNDLEVYNDKIKEKQTIKTNNKTDYEKNK